MRIGEIRERDIGNGPGIRTVLFVTGCRFNCKGCFNKKLQDFNYGEPFSEKHIDQLEKALKSPYIQGLTILGGEPMEHPEVLTDLTRESRRRGALEGKDIWIYSGYTYESLLRSNIQFRLLLEADVLVDGLFVQALYDPNLKYRGSSNQRVINLKDTNKSQNITI